MWAALRCSIFYNSVCGHKGVAWKSVLGFGGVRNRDSWCFLHRKSALHWFAKYVSCKRFQVLVCFHWFSAILAAECSVPVESGKCNKRDVDTSLHIEAGYTLAVQALRGCTTGTCWRRWSSSAAAFTSVLLLPRWTAHVLLFLVKKIRDGEAGIHNEKLEQNILFGFVLTVGACSLCPVCLQRGPRPRVTDPSCDEYILNNLSVL